MKKLIIVRQDDKDKRLDAFLTTNLNKSRSHIQTSIKDGLYTVNDQKVKTGYTLKLGDIISVIEIEAKKLDLEAYEMNLEIIYEDKDLLVVNKPKGLVVHPASSYDGLTLVHGLLHQVDDLSGINGVLRPGIVHRLDKDTSGLMLVAKTDIAHRQLAEDLAEHKIERIYFALVYGKFGESVGSIEAPIKRNAKNRLKMSVDKTGKFAKTNFEVIKEYENYTLVKCILETGRTHQIRVHMSYINHPVVGDPVYGPKPVIGTTGQFLHAKKIGFMHPIKKEYMQFECDIPSDFKEMLLKFEI